MADTAALAAGLDRVWRALAAAVTDRAAPLRTPVVVTADADGRVMVLRDVDRTAATLTFFTDARAAKVAALAAAPAVAVIAWDPGARLQLRLRGTATVVTAGPAADAAWDTVAPPARRAYRTAAAPGTAAPSSAAAARLGDGDGRHTFALLVVALGEIDWLDLAGPDHRRAGHRRAMGRWSGEWRVP